MGLKTTNYKIEGKDLVLPNAYAIIGRVLNIFESGNGTAKIFVQASREHALNFEPLEEKTISFKWDRKSDIARCIYEAAKKKKTRMEQNGKIDENGMPIEVEVVVDEQFYGWYDDIV